ncbi:MAG: hypothetical protein ABIU54_00840, partial [Candidatus Eisenbacteria bacterium]
MSTKHSRAITTLIALAIAASISMLVPLAHAAWSPSGNPITLDPTVTGISGVGGLITSDPLGGAYVQWRVPTAAGVRMYV